MSEDKLISGGDKFDLDYLTRNLSKKQKILLYIGFMLPLLIMLYISGTYSKIWKLILLMGRDLLDFFDMETVINIGKLFGVMIPIFFFFIGIGSLVGVLKNKTPKK